MHPHRFSLRRFARVFPNSHARWYVAIKMATDPLYPAVLKELRRTTAPLLDLGCGMGLLSFYLRAHGFQPPIHGIDYDPRKIDAAQHVLASADLSHPAHDLTFAQGDARLGLPTHQGSITILDILQYFPPAAQAALLTEAASRLLPGALLIIRSGLETPGWRFRFTRWNDRQANRLRWMQAAPVHYPTPESLTSTLTAAGLTGTLHPLHGKTPFNNWLGVFSR
ncbi:MAG: SAM-dependent methyltransferase [Verrucomicrobiales bacterium]|nr:SAM-dependent methyltransferase [Verrucomicrobiales bacterium]